MHLRFRSLHSCMCSVKRSSPLHVFCPANSDCLHRLSSNLSIDFAICRSRVRPNSFSFHDPYFLHFCEVIISLCYSLFSGINFNMLSTLAWLCCLFHMRCASDFGGKYFLHISLLKRGSFSLSVFLRM